jgi:hypothetical protein
MVADVEQHLQVYTPWQYKLSQLYCEPVVTGAVEQQVRPYSEKLMLSPDGQIAVHATA